MLVGSVKIRPDVSIRTRDWKNGSMAHCLDIYRAREKYLVCSCLFVAHMSLQAGQLLDILLVVLSSKNGATMATGRERIGTILRSSRNILGMNRSM